MASGLTRPGLSRTMDRMAPPYSPTTGMVEVDRAVGGLIAGDNLVWEIDSGVAGDHFVSSFVTACENDGIPIV